LRISSSPRGRYTEMCVEGHCAYHRPRGDDTQIHSTGNPVCVWWCVRRGQVAWTRNASRSAMESSMKETCDEEK
jgi:hypothetical protein